MKQLTPMTETAYYILLSLSTPRHGYGIIKYVEELTCGRILLGSGTVYGTIKKMQHDKLVSVLVDEERKTIYKITAAGMEHLKNEIERIKILYNDTISQEALFNE